MVDLSVSLTGDRNVIRNLDQMPEQVRQILAAKMMPLAQQMAELVEDNIRDRLQTRSGELEAGVQYEVDVDGGTVTARVWIDGSRVPYAAAQERGATIPAHMIYPKNAKVLSFMLPSGDRQAALRVAHPGATIAPSYFMRDAYRVMGPRISTEIKKAVVEGIRARMRGGAA